MSASRSLHIDAETGMIRQTLIEVGKATMFGQVLDELERNHRQCTPVRMNAFEDLREKLEAVQVPVTIDA